VASLPIPAFELGGDLSLGGKNGFEGRFFGSFNPSVGYASVSFTSLKSWTPIPSFDVLTLPPFSGSLTFGGVNRTYIAAEGCASFPAPVEPIPNALRFGGEDPAAGPNVCVGFKQESQGGGYDFKVNMSGSVRIGGSSGFEATLNGALDTAAGSADLRIRHAGGWSPLPGALANYFVTPVFDGGCSLRNATADTPRLNCSLDALFVSPIELIPGILKIGSANESAGLGPSLAVRLVQASSGGAYDYRVGVSASVRFGIGSFSLPLLSIVGEFGTGGMVARAVSDAWRPLPFFPSLEIPSITLDMRLGPGGSVSLNVTHEPFNFDFVRDFFDVRASCRFLSSDPLTFPSTACSSRTHSFAT
jgi:hypothetical protein